MSRLYNSLGESFNRVLAKKGHRNLINEVEPSEKVVVLKKHEKVEEYNNKGKFVKLKGGCMSIQNYICELCIYVS